MKIVYLYVGNFVTGKVYRMPIHEDFLDQAIEIFRNREDMEFMVWEIFSTSQAYDEMEFQFNNRMAEEYETWKRMESFWFNRRINSIASIVA